MSWRALVLACLASLAFAGTAFSQTASIANDELLRSARAWEARDRGDLARLALEKLVAARPDSPAALVELGELHLRMADFQAAQAVQQQLDARFPNSPQARTFATEVRFATRDRLQIASVQRLLQINRGADARAELAKLFPDGPPDGVLGIEYFRMLARTPGGWDRALDGLRKLTARHADDPRYELALARQLLGREATSEEGLRRLTSLVDREDVRQQDVDDALGNAIRELGYRRVPVDTLRLYAARHRDDRQIQQALENRIRLETEMEALLADASTARDPERQRATLRELQQALLAMPAAEDPDRAIALLRRLRGAAETMRFDPSTEATLRWAARSRRSGAESVERAAVEKDIAVAFSRRDYEAAIRLADRLESMTSREEADRLLAEAAQFDAGSTWLFEIRVRRLLSGGHAEEAIRLMDRRPTDARWTVAARNELLANALDQRAQDALAAGDVGQARADLTRALELAPTYPWSRYRLAGLLERDNEREAARRLMDEGARLAPADAEMRYAQALFLSSIDDYETATLALAAIPAAQRSQGARDLDKRLRIERVRTSARTLFAGGDTSAARARLVEAEPLAQGDLESTRQLAAAWIGLGDTARGLALFDDFLSGARADDTDVLMAWADTLNRADEDERLGPVLDRLQARSSLDAATRQQVNTLARERELRSIRTLQRDSQYAAAVERAEALLAGSPTDRTLRILRADLDLASGNASAARDRYAALVAEQPDDLDTRLSYARALLGTGDVDLARLQVETVAELAAESDVELQLSLARRQLDLGDSSAARNTLRKVLAAEPTRTDALMLAGRAELADRDFTRARELFTQAERSNDLGIGSEARLAREAIETRLQSWVEAGFELRHKPGDSGISQFDSWVLPSLWRYAWDYERRLTLRADAVSIDAGGLPISYDSAALLGTIQAFGPTASRRYRNEREDGLSLGLGYETDTWSANIGTTPLGFLLTNVVGGLEWAPQWGGIDLAFGIERRAVTSSVLSYAGMRDPVTGREWGGIVETGPYAEAGLYREDFSVAGSVRYAELSGKNVANNTFAGLRGAADWKFWSRLDARAFVGVTLNLWRYEHNLQEYTFGHGGYYSPETYLSITFPVELQGTWRDWSYRVRASLSYSQSDNARAAFYPTNVELQTAAAASPLPAGFDAPYYESDDGGGTSLSAYAAVERQITRRIVVGAKLDIDRADYYEPTTFMLYVRHIFGASTPVVVPPRPVRAYNE